MKSPHNITSFITRLLTLAIAMSTTMAVAQNGVDTTQAQTERPANNAPNNQNPQAEAAQQQDQEDPQDATQRANEEQSRDTAGEVQANTDCIDLSSGVAATENSQRAPEAIVRAMPNRDDCLDLTQDADGSATENNQGGEPANTANSRPDADED